MKFNKDYIKIVAVGLVILVVTIFASIVNGANTKSSISELPVNLSTYIDYQSGTKFLNSKNVLFFKANWCSTCTVADENLSKDIASIPANITIYKVDFEKENKLRATYEVTVQHTFVQVDENGNLLKKWTGSYTIDEIQNELV